MVSWMNYSMVMSRYHDLMGSSSAAGSSQASPRDKDNTPSARASKHKAQPRACDFCRRKKRKCFSLGEVSDVCANCQSVGKACTFELDSTPRGPSKSDIQRMESYISGLELVIRQLAPTSDLTQLLDNAHRNNRPLPVGRSSESGALGPRSDREADPNDSAAVHVGIKRAMDRLAVSDFPLRYHGSSSFHHVYLLIDQVRGGTDVNLLSRVKASLRPKIWAMPSWETAVFGSRIYEWVQVAWPTPDLETKLVDAYFKYSASYLPLMDASMFRKQLANTLYLYDGRFAEVCWLVFAHGARHVDCAEVLWPDGSFDRHSAGWVYFSKCKSGIPSTLEVPDRYSLIITALTCTWLHGSSSPHRPWLYAGSALRSCQEIGLHVGHVMVSDVNDAKEMKRAFWCLFHLDVLHSAIAGRPTVYNDGDLDFDFARHIDGDDEPSRLLVQTLELDCIIARALHTLYRGPRPWKFSTRSTEITDISLALEAWGHALPADLKFDPSGMVGEGSRERAALRVHRCFAQILIYRPALLGSREQDPKSAEALTKCVDAAIEICEVVRSLLSMSSRHAQWRTALSSEFIVPVWTAFPILQLCLSIRYDPKTPRDPGTTWIPELMFQCLWAFQEIERTWRFAGKYTDFMTETMRTLEINYPNACRDHNWQWFMGTANYSDQPKVVNGSVSSIQSSAQHGNYSTDLGVGSGALDIGDTRHALVTGHDLADLTADAPGLDPNISADFDLLFAELFGLGPTGNTYASDTTFPF